MTRHANSKGYYSNSGTYTSRNPENNPAEFTPIKNIKLFDILKTGSKNNHNPLFLKMILDDDYYNFIIAECRDSKDIECFLSIRNDEIDKQDNIKKFSESDKIKKFDFHSIDSTFRGTPRMVYLDYEKHKELIFKQSGHDPFTHSLKKVAENTNYNDLREKDLELRYEEKLKTQRISLIKVDYNFEFLTQGLVNILGIEQLKGQQEIKTDIHSLNSDELENDDLPSTVEGISHSVERYFEAIDEGNFSSVFTGGFCLPGNSGHYESCMKIGLKGCFGSNIDNQDKDQRTAVLQDNRHSKFNSAYAKFGDETDKITHMKKIFLTCKRMSCGRCYKRSVNHVSKNATLRMFAFITLLVSNFGLNQKRYFNHSVVSVPLEKYEAFKDVKSRKKYEAIIRNDLKVMGIHGGLMIYHPYRFTKKLNHAYFSPHYHFILAGYTESRAVKEFHLKRGFVYVAFPNVDSMGKPFVGSDRLYHTIRYILSHCGITKDKHTVKYFGLAHNKFFKTENILKGAIDSIDEIKENITEIVNPKSTPGYTDFTKEHLRRTFKLKSIKIQKMTLQNEEIEKILIDPIEYPKINDVLIDGICADISNFMLDDSVINYTDGGIDGTDQVMDHDGIDNPANPLSVILKNSEAYLIKTIHEVTVTRFDPLKYHYYKEKCYDKTSINIITSSGSKDELCRLCNFKVKSLMLLSENKSISEVPLVSNEKLFNFIDYDLEDNPTFFDDVPEEKLFLTHGDYFRYQTRLDFINGFPFFDHDGKKTVLKYDNKVMLLNKHYRSYHADYQLEVMALIRSSMDRAIRNHIKQKIFREELTGDYEDHLDHFVVVPDKDKNPLPYKVIAKPLTISRFRKTSKPLFWNYTTTRHIQKIDKKY